MKRENFRIATSIIENKNIQHISKEDPRLYVEDINYPGETGDIIAHLAKPKDGLKLLGVIVIMKTGVLPPISNKSLDV